MMENNDEGYGTVTIGYGSAKQKQLKVLDFVQSSYSDHRLISMAELEDGTFTITVENPASTDRLPQSTMRLSRESLIGLINNARLYFMCKEINLEKELKQITQSGKIAYTCSNNLKPIQPTK